MLKRKRVALILSVCFFVFSVAPLEAATPFPEGTVLKGEFAEVFLVTAGETLQWIPDETTFKALGYNWSAIMTVDNTVLYQYKFGAPLTTIAQKTTPATPAEIEVKVRALFADAPIMISVAQCESGFAQFRNDGSLVRSRNGLYIGVFQIDENIHGEYALSLGMDIKTVDGNLAYARRLYEQSGARPWQSCATASAPIRSNLKMGDVNPEVQVLQKMLNGAGYTISSTGPGSAGNETEYFGTLTRDAVRKFQCDKGIVCSGDEETTGYGLVGLRTRTALSSL